MSADMGDMDLGITAPKLEEKSRIDVARSQFVDKVISLLEGALSKDLLSFTSSFVMNYEEVLIRMPYGEYCVVLGRRDKNQAYRSYAADHTFRICKQNGADIHWFGEPFVLNNDTISQDQFLYGLRDRLAGLHNRLMKKEAPEDLNKLSNQLFEQSRFIRYLQDSLFQVYERPLKP